VKEPFILLPNTEETQVGVEGWKARWRRVTGNAPDEDQKPYRKFLSGGAITQRGKKET
jgi:hypothetical protein